MMTKRKLFLITVLFFLALTAIRFVWMGFLAIPDHPEAVQGNLDLSKWDFSTQRAITLNGEWEYYPDTLLGQDSVSTSKQESRYIQVPGNIHSPSSAEHNPAFGYGSYRLRVKVDPDNNRMYGIRITNIPTSSALYVNGELLAKSGQPASDKERYTARNVPYSTTFPVNVSEIDIVIETANYHNPGINGILKSVKFGSAPAIIGEEQFSEAMQITVAVILLLHEVYACLLYMIGIRQKALLWFAMLILCAIVMILSDDDRLLLVWLPVSFEWGIKLLSLSTIGVSVFLFQFFKHFLPEYSAYRWVKWFSAVYWLLAITIAVLPVFELLGMTISLYLHSALLLVGAIWPMLFLRNAIKRDTDAIFLALAATGIVTSSLWGAISTIFGLEIGYYPFDLIAAILAFAAYWFRRYIRTFAETSQLAAKLQKADKIKDDFLANTSHELRNPLHGMLNIAQTVLDSERNGMDRRNAENMELLVSIGRRMSFLLNDLLDLTRLHEGGIRLQPGTVRIQAVASGVLDMLRFMLEGKPIRFILTIPESFPPVTADENRLVQIMFNLLHNAVKFTNEGSITIHAEILDGKACITITDTGIGMDEETQRRIFQRYEQGDSGITSIGGGIGLGLSISKQLVELHGGTLEVNSSPDHGSVFSFDLDLAGSAIGQADNERSASYTLTARQTAVTGSGSRITAVENRPCILAVDDDPINLSIMKDILGEESYRIVAVTSGKEALSLLKTREWDLVISDVMMPRMSGYELASTIRNRFTVSELPILLLTARSRPEDVEAGFRSGANDYVTKPMDAMELRSRVKALTSLTISVREQLRTEAACLQAQIQPHFLFNTLNSIAALSEMDMNRMRKLLGVFGNYLRASFDFQNTSRLVPLTHELKLVEAYLYIEKERFEERLRIVWEGEENLQLLIPPLSIQPLVENAVRHGLLARSRGGTLTIRIEDRVESAFIEVADDGVGMDEATLHRALDPSPSSHTGIGLRNTDRRLKQIYGSGLHIDSRLGQGTTISFTVTK